METFTIKETVEQLLELERKNPGMKTRLLWLRTLKTNPNIGIAGLVKSIGVTEFEMSRWAALYRFGGIELLLNPKTILDTSVNGAKSFSDHALEKLRELYTNHPEQLGRQLWIDFDHCRKGERSGTDCTLFDNYKEFDMKFKNWRRTDCQTYIQDVIRFSYEKIGRRDLYDGLSAYYKKNGITGTSMAKYLVTKGWKAYLFSPDTENPYRTNYERIAKNSVKTMNWWGVPLSGYFFNYAPTQRLQPGQKLTPLDAESLKRLGPVANIKFAACVFTAGYHTGVLSQGNILEVHWKNISEQTVVDKKYQQFQATHGGQLYEKTNLLDFDWAEGVFVVPPDSSVSLI